MDTTESDAASPRLLIVEDEPQQRETLAMLFEGEGYNVRATDSAETAMDILATHRPDLVITDVKLTGLDGISFFEVVRSREEGRHVPFIFMTAYNDVDAIERVKKMGSVDYITKPFNLEDLIALVRSRGRA
jgi:two-component system, OmpR family, response regulator